MKRTYLLLSVFIVLAFTSCQNESDSQVADSVVSEVTQDEESFKKLKNLLYQNNYLYVTAETSGFGENGALKFNDLSKQLGEAYGKELPTYLAGASAGGRK